MKKIVLFFVIVCGAINLNALDFSSLILESPSAKKIQEEYISQLDLIAVSDQEKKVFSAGVESSQISLKDAKVTPSITYEDNKNKFVLTAPVGATYTNKNWDVAPTLSYTHSFEHEVLKDARLKTKELAMVAAKKNYVASMGALETQLLEIMSQIVITDKNIFLTEADILKKSEVVENDLLSGELEIDSLSYLQKTYEIENLKNKLENFVFNKKISIQQFEELTAQKYSSDIMLILLSHFSEPEKNTSQQGIAVEYAKMSWLNAASTTKKIDQNENGLAWSLKADGIGSIKSTAVSDYSFTGGAGVKSGCFTVDGGVGAVFDSNGNASPVIKLGGKILLKSGSSKKLNESRITEKQKLSEFKKAQRDFDWALKKYNSSVLAWHNKKSLSKKKYEMDKKLYERQKILFERGLITSSDVRNAENTILLDEIDEKLHKIEGLKLYNTLHTLVGREE